MSGAPQPHESTRAYYRVSYPVPERPRFIWDDIVFEVLDCSEKGFRFLAGEHKAVELGTALTGVIRFRRGARVDVRGHVVRSDQGQVAVELTTPIPLPTIYDEQRYLRKFYPMWL